MEKFLRIIEPTIILTCLNNKSNQTDLVIHKLNMGLLMYYEELQNDYCYRRCIILDLLPEIILLVSVPSVDLFLIKHYIKVTIFTGVNVISRFTY